MAVNQYRRRAGHGGRFGIDDRIAGRFDPLDFQAQSAEMVDQPLGGSANVGLVFALGTDAFDA